MKLIVREVLSDTRTVFDNDLEDIESCASHSRDRSVQKMYRSLCNAMPTNLCGIRYRLGYQSTSFNSVVYKGELPLLHLYHATSWFSRLRGLFAFPRLSASTALLLQPCSAVHTVGMQYTIDVAFLDKSGVIIKVVQLAPGSISVCRKAHCVIEMLAGTVERLDIGIGQQICVKRFVAIDPGSDEATIGNSFSNNPVAMELLDDTRQPE